MCFIFFLFRPALTDTYSILFYSIEYYLILDPARLYDSYIMSLRVKLIFPVCVCFFTCMLSLSLKEMEAEVYRVLRGGSSHDVLSEGFGLRLTRKDLQTLSSLNWLNDEVSTQTRGVNSFILHQILLFCLCIHQKYTTVIMLCM